MSDPQERNDPIDYGRFEEGRHCNYWDLDRTVQRELSRVSPEEAFEWDERRPSRLSSRESHSSSDSAMSASEESGCSTGS